MGKKGKKNYVSSSPLIKFVEEFMCCHVHGIRLGIQQEDTKFAKLR